MLPQLLGVGSRRVYSVPVAIVGRLRLRLRLRLRFPQADAEGPLTPFVRVRWGGSGTRSVKITNATYTHYGEMAHWQARGVLAFAP